MPVYLKKGTTKVLLSGSKVAFDPKCCCSGVTITGDHGDPAPAKTYVIYKIVVSPFVSGGVVLWKYNGVRGNFTPNPMSLNNQGSCTTPPLYTGDGPPTGPDVLH